MSDGKASLDPGITGIIVDSELKVIKSIPGYNVDYGSLVGGSDPYIGEHTRVRAPRTKHKEKGIPGWYSFLLVPYIGGYAAMW